MLTSTEDVDNLDTQDKFGTSFTSNRQQSKPVQSDSTAKLDSVDKFDSVPEEGCHNGNVGPWVFGRDFQDSPAQVQGLTDVAGHGRHLKEGRVMRVIKGDKG